MAGRVPAIRASSAGTKMAGLDPISAKISARAYPRVMAGLGPATHDFAAFPTESRGYQAKSDDDTKHSPVLSFLFQRL